MCPVTSKAKGYPFEVFIPQDLPLDGVILSDQIKSLDWQSRQVKFIGRVPKETLDEVLSKVDLLIH
nr:type II toxin-antitoxin system PemK/MazF family toxin [Paenibacillus uliginis]